MANFDTQKLIDIIGSSELCCYMGAKDLPPLLKYLSFKQLNPDELIIKKGEMGKSFYIVISGELSVYDECDGTKNEIARLYPGHVVGEIAFLDDSPRTLNVGAIRPSVIAEFKRMKVMEYAQINAMGFARLLLGLNKILCQRIRYFIDASSQQSVKDADESSDEKASMSPMEDIGAFDLPEIEKKVSSLQVLIITAYKNAGRYLTNMLQGYASRKIEEASNLKRAITRARETQFDLMICQHSPPHIELLELLKDIRENDNIKHVDIVCVGPDDEKLMLKSFERGALGYIISPFSQDTVKKTFDQILERQYGETPPYPAVRRTGERLLMGKIEEAEKMLKEAILLHPSNIEVLTIWVKILRAKRQYDEAMRYLKRLLSICNEMQRCPENSGPYLRFKTAWAWRVLGEIAYECEQMDLAEQAFQNSRRVNPYDPRTYYGLGIVFTKMGRYKVAYMFFLQALQSDPSSGTRDDITQAMCDLAWKCLSENLRPLADEIMEKLDSIRENSPILNQEVCKYYHKIGAIDKAIPIAKEMLAEGMATSEIIITYVNSLLLLKDLPPSDKRVKVLGYAMTRSAIDDAQKALEEGISFYSQDWKLWTTFGKVLILKGETEKGLEAYDKAFQLKNDDPVPKIQMINDLREAGMFEEAFVEAESAYKLFPNDSEILELLIRSQIDGGKTEEAMTIIKERLKKEPKNQTLLRLLGLVHLHLNDPDKAKECLQLLMKFSPNDMEGKRLLREAMMRSDK